MNLKEQDTGQRWRPSRGLSPDMRANFTVLAWSLLRQRHGEKARHRTGGLDQALRRSAGRGLDQSAHTCRFLLLPSGAFGLRQDNDAAHDRGPRGSERGRRHPGVGEHHQPAAGRARHGDDVPELRAVPSSRLHRQRRLQPQDARHRQGHPPRPRARHAEAGADGAFCRPTAGPALGRPAAAGGACPRLDHRSAGAAARRAAVGARSFPAHQDAGRAEIAADAARHQLHPRHPQPGRGDGAGRSGRRHERRQDRAGGPVPSRQRER